jgi:predicted transcriptional regulator
MITTTISLPEELHAELKQIAEAERRSFTQTVVMELQKAVDKRRHRERVRELAERVRDDHQGLLDRLA